MKYVFALISIFGIVAIPTQAFSKPTRATEALTLSPPQLQVLWYTMMGQSPDDEQVVRIQGGELAGLNEFERGPAIQKARKEFNDTAAMLSKTAEFSFPTSARLGEYNFQTNSFPVDLLTEKSFTFWDPYPPFSGRHAIQGELDQLPEEARYLKVEPNEAKLLVADANPQNRPISVIFTARRNKGGVLKMDGMDVCTVAFNVTGFKYVAPDSKKLAKMTPVQRARLKQTPLLTLASWRLNGAPTPWRGPDLTGNWKGRAELDANSGTYFVQISQNRAGIWGSVTARIDKPLRDFDNAEMEGVVNAEKNQVILNLTGNGSEMDLTPTADGKEMSGTFKNPVIGVGTITLVRAEAAK